MKIIFALTIVAIAFASSQARAQERAGDAALGALSGAVVFGPVGLVAGAVVGFTAGPAIARSWRANRDHPRHYVGPAKRPARVAAKQRTAAPSRPEAGSVAPQPAAKGGGGPPVNGFE